MIAGGATGRQAPRIFYGWWVVAGSVVGVSVGSAQFAFGSLGLFITPFGTEFGWSRTAISLALTIFTVAQALAAPVIGHLIDRFGARLVLLPSLLIYAILLASIPVVAGAFVAAVLDLFLDRFACNRRWLHSVCTHHQRLVRSSPRPRAWRNYGWRRAGFRLRTTVCTVFYRYLRVAGWLLRTRVPHHAGVPCDLRVISRVTSRHGAFA